MPLWIRLARRRMSICRTLPPQAQGSSDVLPYLDWALIAAICEETENGPETTRCSTLWLQGGAGSISPARTRPKAHEPSSASEEREGRYDPLPALARSRGTLRGGADQSPLSLSRRLPNPVRLPVLSTTRPPAEEVVSGEPLREPACACWPVRRGRHRGTKGGEGDGRESAERRPAKECHPARAANLTRYVCPWPAKFLGLAIPLSEMRNTRFAQDGVRRFATSIGALAPQLLDAAVLGGCAACQRLGVRRCALS